ncbi:hypothetical protein OX459_08470 [Janthinobacterium sp. SUN026]|uniref:GTP pyrophosphokinase n=1 Tax=Janthinobacterium sp. SUN026 TaxID=3002438 RepID=UPI0025B15079|nr:hypothetical protein [Janthinobacterium sp. SUN026]MDN2671421.1 hypothetical protein [Janthinobacterium sp. SUN026]
MDSPLNSIWKDRPDLIRGYYEMLSNHQRLCDEVQYILEKKIKHLGIEIGNLSSRAKTLASFCEKIKRKTYARPLEEITDLSGVRIVFLYASDRLKLEQLVEREFDILEKVDKLSDQGFEKFGYGALHYIVKLKKQHAGARYDDLREFRCEIQIRTILQDAWAIVAHHLSYKHEEDIPKELKRKLYALAGLFETADDQFERINYLRGEYQEGVKKSMIDNSELSLDVDVNLDNLLGYISWKFPDRRESTAESASSLLEELNNFGYKKLKDIDSVVNETWDAVLARETKYPPHETDSDEITNYVGVGLIRSALELVNKEYLKFRNPDGEDETVDEFLGFIK